MTINVNDKLWTPNEKSSIIKSAAEAYENAMRRIRVFRLDDWTRRRKGRMRFNLTVILKQATLMNLFRYKTVK